jgi:lipid II:glycine glycyltransferase (peptidoglycan interpeptide bridge formation enzyme)
MNPITKPYFLQDPRWANFWQSAHNSKHSFQQFSHFSNGITYSTIAYTYPWHFGQSFLYLPRFCVITAHSNSTQLEIQSGLREFLNLIVQKAQDSKHTFIKLDTGFDFQQATGIQTNDDFKSFIQQNTPNLTVSHSKKTLQYLSTMVLDCANLQAKTATETYLDFYLNNKQFWGKTNENVRRYTKKSCSQNWKIDSSTTVENFEKFWQVYQHTAQKHDFGIHPKRYFETMMKHDFVRIITLSDDQGVQSGWFGVVFDDTMYYLYGGNTDISFKKYGQYFIHLLATDLISQETLIQYDLGGYDAKKGFGKFKEGYRGEIVSALGPIDIILKPIKHSFTYSVVANLKKITKSLIK